jgi:CheY-like chemotaxis protein
MKTLGFEIAEQLGRILHPDQTGKWQSPDWYIQAVSGGIGPLGVWKGFSELHTMGLIDKIPRLGIVQAAGCAPMVKAFEAGKSTADPVVPKTLITVLATGDPGFSYVQLREAVLSNGGAMLAIEDGETFRSMRHLASRAGVSVEPATAVAFAGLEKMLADGTIKPGETVVVNCSGHTFPAESHVLGDQYDKYILDLELKKSSVAAMSAPKEEGLGAALQNLDEQVTTIVIVDDNANDRRLIRRLLQSYKRYRVYEARDGIEAISVIRERKPDLVVTDLTMPESDGFSLLETLKKDPETANIPVVVVSAKSLSNEDRERLASYSESIWMKGGFDTRALVDHVVTTLGHKPIHVIQPERAKLQEVNVISQTDEAMQGTPMVVVIDDNPQDLRLARRMLESGGKFHIIEESSGREGLKAIYKYHPDLIILDLMLPDVDGFSILDTLQKDANLSEIPVIVFSAKELTGAEESSIQKQIRSLMQKSSLDRKRFLDMVKHELK